MKLREHVVSAERLLNDCMMPECSEAEGQMLAQAATAHALLALVKVQTARARALSANGDTIKTMMPQLVDHLASLKQQNENPTTVTVVHEVRDPRASEN